MTLEKRDTIGKDDVSNLLPLIKHLIFKRMQEKGNTTFASRHEIFGILEEEMGELKGAMRNNDMDEFYNELGDIAVGAIFGMVCISCDTLDW